MPSLRPGRYSYTLVMTARLLASARAHTHMYSGTLFGFCRFSLQIRAKDFFFFYAKIIPVQPLAMHAPEYIMYIMNVWQCASKQINIQLGPFFSLLFFILIRK